MGWLTEAAALKIHNEFSIPLTPSEAWEVLNDIPRVAACVPGARLLERADDGAYIGTIALRLGPVALSFKGKFIYKEIDEAARRVRAEAMGSEEKARGTARALIDFTLREDDLGTRVSVDTDVQLAGSIAQYARGGSLIESTAQVLIGQFADNLRAEIGRASAAIIPSGSGAAASESIGTFSPESREAFAEKSASITPRAAGEISAVVLLFEGLKLMLRRWFAALFGARG